MNRKEIKEEIARILSEGLEEESGEYYEDESAEKILQFLENIGFEWEASYEERRAAVYSVNDPNFSGNLPK